MSFHLTGPEGIYAGLDALNLTSKSWDVQFDGGKDKHSVVDYGHGADAASATAWLRFTVTQDDVNVVLQGDWDFVNNIQTMSVGATAATLKAVSQLPFNNKPFIDPGISEDGSQVWFRYGETKAGNHTKEYRFHAPIHVDAGQIAGLLKTLGV